MQIIRYLIGGKEPAILKFAKLNVEKNSNVVWQTLMSQIYLEHLTNWAIADSLIIKGQMFHWIKFHWATLKKNIKS